MGNDGVFAVIAEGTRRQILDRLREGDKAVGELVVELQVSQPTVSKHLKVLREAGLVTMRAQGQKRFYSLEAAPLRSVRDWLEAFDRQVDPDAAEDTDTSDAVGDVPLHAAGQGAPSLASAVESIDRDAEEAGVLAAAVLAGPGNGTAADAPRPQLGRTMGRAAERAADLLSQLRRRRES